MKAHLLCFGHDAVLLRTRGWVLETYFRVELASEIGEVSALAQKYRFDLAILCHSLTPEECQHAVNLLRSRWADTKILSLGSWSDDCSTGIHHHQTVEPLKGPRALLTKISEMLGSAQRED